jgi:hypothetical protein
MTAPGRYPMHRQELRLCVAGSPFGLLVNYMYKSEYKARILLSHRSAKHSILSRICIFTDVQEQLGNHGHDALLAACIRVPTQRDQPV